jgi:hypothetical protein
MKKITNILVGLLFASSLAFTSALQAGELSVSGSATATITKGGRIQHSGQQVGVANELAFGASGELDNGMTWNYVTELDGTSTITDDVQLTISGGFGTVGFFSSEGGLSTDVLGVGAIGSGKDYADTYATWKVGYDVDGYGNVQYHLPGGILPLGGSLKVGYVPTMQNTNVNSAKGNEAIAAVEDVGRTLTQVQVGLAPIDGVTIKADAAWTDNSSGETSTNASTKGEQGVSGNAQIVYAVGPFKVGYSQGAHQPAVASGANTVYYENKGYAASFALIENVVVSYYKDESKQTSLALAATGTTKTKTAVTMEQDTYQIAYTMGGMTIGYSMAEASNTGYSSAAGKTTNVNILSVAMAF